MASHVSGDCILFFRLKSIKSSEEFALNQRSPKMSTTGIDKQPESQVEEDDEPDEW